MPLGLLSYQKFMSILLLCYSITLLFYCKFYHCVPPERYTELLTPPTCECDLVSKQCFQIADVVKSRWGYESGPLSNTTGVLIKERDGNTEENVTQQEAETGMKPLWAEACQGSREPTRHEEKTRKGYQSHGLWAVSLRTPSFQTLASGTVKGQFLSF